MAVDNEPCKSIRYILRTLQSYIYACVTQTSLFFVKLGENRWFALSSNFTAKSILFCSVTEISRISREYFNLRMTSFLTLHDQWASSLGLLRVNLLCTLAPLVCQSANCIEWCEASVMTVLLIHNDPRSRHGNVVQSDTVFFLYSTTYPIHIVFTLFAGQSPTIVFEDIPQVI